MSGRAGAPETADGVAPAANEVKRGVVGADGSPEVMDARGNAVGFVDSSDTGTVDKAEAVGVAAPAPEPVGTVDAVGAVALPADAGPEDCACTTATAAQTKKK